MKVRLTIYGFLPSLFAAVLLVATIVPETQAQTCGNNTVEDADFVSVSAGKNHSCALESTGAVRCWGEDYAGQATAPPGIFSAVSAGGNYSCAINSSGAVECWGYDGGGQSSSPSGTFTEISSGDDHACAIKSSGAVECWGSNSDGETDVPFGLTLQGPATTSARSCALDVNKAIYCWGMPYGQDGPPTGEFEQIALGDIGGCALNTAGTVLCWGELSGEVPEDVLFTGVSVGTAHACGLSDTGAVHCWGDNAAGQSEAPEGSYVEVSAGGLHSCAVRASGDIDCWGSNFRGQSWAPDPNDELCDDGQETAYCDADCTDVVCGDGYENSTIVPPEECDDGVANSDTDRDACRTNCTLPGCGDDTIDSGEQCDNGERNSDVIANACRTDCSAPGCGDGTLDLGEECDAGANNAFAPDACRPDCTVPSCGDGIIDESIDESCDDGNTIDDGNGCSEDCVVVCAVGCASPCNPHARDCDCGNGALNSGEQCDDGNDLSGDSCDFNCTFPACGNGIKNLDQNGIMEACDDGNDDDLDFCTNNCALGTCGNGALDPGEHCDDGNRTSGDGCSARCEGDFDNDGVFDQDDNCQWTANTDQADYDTDTVGDVCDNCPSVSNASQEDYDGDGVGYACEDTTTTTTLPEPECGDGQDSFYKECTAGGQTCSNDCLINWEFSAALIPDDKPKQLKLHEKKVARQRVCMENFTKKAVKLYATNTKLAAACVKDATRASDLAPGSSRLEMAMTCVAEDAYLKSSKAADTLLKIEEKKCSHEQPPFGYGGAGFVQNVADEQNRGVLTDLFGENDGLVAEAVDRAKGKCQARVVKDYAKIAKHKASAYSKCKGTNPGLKSGKFLTSISLSECLWFAPVCVGGASDGNPCNSNDDCSPVCSGGPNRGLACADDTACGAAGDLTWECAGVCHGESSQKSLDKIAGAKAKLLVALGKVTKGNNKSKCGDVVLGETFPGICQAAPDDQGFAGCVDERMDCRLCLFLNATDRIGKDCDLFDDNVDNDSCVGWGEGGAGEVAVYEFKTSKETEKLQRYIDGGSYDGVFGTVIPAADRSTAQHSMLCEDPPACQGGANAGAWCISDVDCGGSNTCEVGDCPGVFVNTGDGRQETNDLFKVWYPMCALDDDTCTGGGFEFDRPPPAGPVQSGPGWFALQIKKGCEDDDGDCTEGSWGPWCEPDTGRCPYGSGQLRLGSAVYGSAYHVVYQLDVGQGKIHLRLLKK